MPAPFGCLAVPGCITAGIDSHLFLPTGSDYISNSLLKEIARLLQYLLTRSVTSKHRVSNTLSHSDFRRCLVGSQLWVYLGNLKSLFNGLQRGLARTCIGKRKRKEVCRASFSHCPPHQHFSTALAQQLKRGFNHLLEE